MVLEDIRGKSVPAIEVFGLSINALVSHLTDILDKQGTGMDKSEIQWVLTVPAIWTDAAKQFMRKSAVNVSSDEKTQFKYQHLDRHTSCLCCNLQNCTLKYYFSHTFPLFECAINLRYTKNL